VVSKKWVSFVRKKKARALQLGVCFDTRLAYTQNTRASSTQRKGGGYDTSAIRPIRARCEPIRPMRPVRANTTDTSQCEPILANASELVRVQCEPIRVSECEPTSARVRYECEYEPIRANTSVKMRAITSQCESDTSQYECNANQYEPIRANTSAMRAKTNQYEPMRVRRANTSAFACGGARAPTRNFQCATSSHLCCGGAGWCGLQHVAPWTRLLLLCSLRWNHSLPRA
jgi:hypothetical protein